MGSILIVEDDQTLRNLIIRSLKSSGFSAIGAENGLLAKDLFDSQSEQLAAIVSDIRMPEMDGIDLLRHVRTSSKLPVILVTGFSEILETRDAFKMGATDFISKPFRIEDLVNSLKKCLSEDAEAGEEELFCQIHIDEFIASSKLISDIYIRLSANKFVKVAHKGEEVSVERLRNYKQKNVEYLYVTAGDFGDYVDFTIKLTDVAMKSSAIDRDKRLRLLRNTTEAIVANCFLNELTPDLVEPAQRMVEDTLSIVMREPESLNALLNLQTYSDRVYGHCVAVSLYACLVAKMHGWTSANTQFRLSIAGLFHDIGKKEIDKAIVAKTRMNRSAEEIKTVESHPVRSRDLILQIKNLPEDISQIVYQHHENPSGTGYPQGLKGEEVHPLARLLSTVDHFVDHIVPISTEMKPMPPKKAISHILLNSVDKVDLTFFRRLMEIFNVEA